MTIKDDTGKFRELTEKHVEFISKYPRWIQLSKFWETVYFLALHGF